MRGRAVRRWASTNLIADQARYFVIPRSSPDGMQLLRAESFPESTGRESRVESAERGLEWNRERMNKLVGSYARMRSEANRPGAPLQVQKCGLDVGKMGVGL